MREFSKKTVISSTGVGLSHMVLFVLIWRLQTGTNVLVVPDGVVHYLQLLFILIGIFLLGAVPIALLIEESIYFPVAVVTFAFAFIVYEQAGTDPTNIWPPLFVYGMGWFVVLCIAVLAGTAEYYARRRIDGVVDGAPTEPGR